MPIPGIYAINSTGETVPLATEDGGGDRNLFREMVEEMDLEESLFGDES